MFKCQCLNLFVQDPRLPFRLDYVAGKYYLDLTKDISIEVQHCPRCSVFEDQEVEPCACPQWKEWANRPDVPIEFDQELNEFHLLIANGYKLIWFCPICGGRMPESTRGSLFTEPSPEEMAKIKQQLGSAGSIDQVIEKLGPPDERFPAYVAEPIDKYLYGTRGWKTSIRYSSRWETVVLTVLEYEDGKIAFAYSGQSKGPSP